MRSTLRPRAPAWLLLLALALTPGCAARWAYQQGLGEAKKGNWDLAVARLTRALQKDPDNIGYKIALENARSHSSRQHQLEGRKHVAADDLEKAAEELGIAVNFDPANRAAIDDLALVREKARQRAEERQRQAELEASKVRGQGAQYPVPVLSPRSPAAIAMSFPDQSLEKVFTALGKVAGVNVLFDEGYRDKPKVTVNLMGVSFEEALEQLTFSNRLFYKVLDRNTIIIVPEGQPKRRQYDDVFLRTFYLRNTETKDVEAVVKGVLGAQGKVASNATLGAITVTGTIDQLALAERVIEANDKARGEVVVELQILEVNRKRAKDYGIELANSNYTAGVTLSPTGGKDEAKGDLLSVRAHLLSSLNLSDFIVNIPATVVAKFLQTDNAFRILAAPKLRAAEGKKTSLKIGEEVPIPVTTFTAAQTAGTGTFAPATSFTYKTVGVSLQITPRIAAGGEITLEMSAEFSSPGTAVDIAGQKLPAFLTRNVDGVLRLRDGETTLLGGLLQRNETTTLKGVLGVQDIPILGSLFSSHTAKVDDTEILISITPRLVRAPQVTEADLKPLYIGTQDLPKVPSARPPLFGAPEEPAASPKPQASPGAPAPTARPSPGAAATPAATTRPAVAAALTPLEARVKPGEATAVSVVLMNAQDLTGVEVVIAFDPALVEALDAAPGSLMTLGGVTVGAERSIEPGRVRVKLSRASGVAGSGVVAAVTVKGLKEGTSSVIVETLTVTTASGRQQVQVASPVHITVQP